MKARKGFTLAELLIVIVVIGILMSGMLLSGSSATSSARALSIVSDLRVMKQAVLLMYIDSMDHFDRGLTPKFESLTPAVALARYVDNPGKYDGRYRFAVSGAGKWYVSYTVGEGDAGAGEIKSNLTGRAGTDGLFEEAGQVPYKGGPTVYMLAR
ncbi:MAG: type II secretion system protein [Fretibacterium sp.]|nr:type II secretion system protein [Fretibacterium sp.]